ncbi:PucR family transcriptional regulator [Bacillus coagulans]|uniref:PucR family transcriptional regulator n=1 Tax=Heyndrickxia coagulans TaxID=1398 RepID=UPI00137806D6|nr:PucR family transcriptional regulator ligand-binding domain-containing protein [Heyndrickxia coagulans]NCG68892.1 PucR family transcriptional regulator [Heyndrickxia coagulans]
MITLEKLIELPAFNRIVLAAGKEGVSRAVTGVNVTESLDWADFFRPNELIVTTGISMDGDPVKLLEMAKFALHRRAAGIVINTGPYIQEIPAAILDFADEHQFPVFQMPWECRVADFIKFTVQFLMTEQVEQTHAQQILNDLLFHPGMSHEQILNELSKLGFGEDADYGIIVCTKADEQQPDMLPFQQTIEEVFGNRYEQYLSSVCQDQIIYLVDRSKVRTPDIPFSKTAEKIQASILKRDMENLLVGMGNFYRQIPDIHKSYQEAKMVIQLAKRQAIPPICKYKEIGAYKIIMEVKDRKIIETFHDDMLENLYRYDELHETDYVHFLKIFLEEDGQTAKISRRAFIHRNTVLYKVKKIESILDVDLTRNFTKTNLLLAFMIEDILQ